MKNTDKIEEMMTYMMAMGKCQQALLGQLVYSQAIQDDLSTDEIVGLTVWMNMLDELMNGFENDKDFDECLRGIRKFYE
jgi:hypothetical protein